MRRAIGPALAALGTGLLLLVVPAAPATADTGGGAAAAAIAAAGAVTASRADVGTCVTLTGGGFTPHAEVKVFDGREAVRTVRAGANGEIAAGVCFNGAARPGPHALSAIGARGSGTHTVSSSVYVVGGSATADAPHHGSSATRARIETIVAVAVLVGVPLVVLVVTLTMLLRASGRRRSRRRLARQASDADLVIDSASVTADPAWTRRRAAVVPLLAGLAVTALLTVAYGAARGADLLRQVHHAVTADTAAVHHLQRGELVAATAQAHAAVVSTTAARREQDDLVVRLLGRLPGLHPVDDALDAQRQVAEDVAVSIDDEPDAQQAQAAAAMSHVRAISDTGWATIDDRTDSLRDSITALGGQALARGAADGLRTPMLENGRRYLLLVQDDRQARATGGVITVHALLSVGAHALSLQQVSAADRSWQVLNLTPDFPSVANAAVAQWRADGGPEVDGVAAVDDVALTRLGADPDAPPAKQLGTAFDALRAATSSPAGFNAALVAAASGGHVLLWSAHPDEEQQLSRLTVGGALKARPANALEVVTQSIGEASGTDAGMLQRHVAYLWRPTLRRDDVGAGPQLMTEASVDVRLTNTGSAPQTTWLSLYLPKGSGFLRGSLDGTAITLHADDLLGASVLSTVVTVPARGSSLLSVRLVQPSPDGGSPVYVEQPRIVPDVVKVVRL